MDYVFASFQISRIKHSVCYPLEMKKALITVVFATLSVLTESRAVIFKIWRLTLCSKLTTIPIFRGEERH